MILPVLRNAFLLLAFVLVTSCQGKSKKDISRSDSGKQQVETGELRSGISIHDAAFNGNLALVEKIVSAGIEIDSLDDEGRTPLMYAAFNGHTAIVKVLVKNGAEVNKPDPNKRTALMFAASGPFPETVLFLLEQGANPNLTDVPEKYTALMYAAAEGNIENVKILLNYKADPDILDVDGDDASTFALNNGHKEVVEIINSFRKKNN